jgi:hypothetical protein
MKVKLNFKNNNYIVIDVLEENSDWFLHFQNMHPQVTNSTLCPSSPYSQSKYQEIHEISKKLVGQGIALSYSLSETYDQQLLNQIHRFFTYNALRVNGDLNDDPFFKIDDAKSFIKDINQLNIIVHELESSTITPAKEYIKTYYPEFKGMLFRAHTGTYADPAWFTANNTQIKIQNEYLNIEASVVMAEEIQGKSYLRAFIDNDDPREIDVTGRFGSYGGFIVDTVGDRKQIYKSKEFNDWLASYGLNKENLLLEWPLGQIKDTSMLLSDFNATEFIGVDFIND